MSVLGVDLGGTKLAAAVFSDRGDVLVRTVEPLGGRAGAAVGDLIARTVTDLLARSPESVTHVGTCVPGIYAPDTGRVWAPNIPGWESYPLREELERTVGSDVGLRIASDRACCILGEIWQGAARGCTDAVFLAVGTGIGAGIVCGGRILDGRRGIAGAIGWLALDRPFRDGYETWGCFEYAASGDGLVRHAHDVLERLPRTERSYGRLTPAEPFTARDVFEAYENGDPIAEHVVDNAVELWGMAAANLVSLFNPEKILFGGGVFGPAVSLLDRIRTEAARWAQPIAMRQVVLEAAALGAEAALYGAAALALDESERNVHTSTKPR